MFSALNTCLCVCTCACLHLCVCIHRCVCARVCVHSYMLYDKCTVHMHCEKITYFRNQQGARRCAMYLCTMYLYYVLCVLCTMHVPKYYVLCVLCTM